MTVSVPEVCREHPLGCASVRVLEGAIDALAPYALWKLFAMAAVAGLLSTVAVVHLRERLSGRPHRYSLATKLALAIGAPAALALVFLAGHYLAELTAPGLWLIDRSPAVTLISVLAPLTLAAIAWIAARAKSPHRRVRDYPYSRWRALREALGIESAKDFAVNALMVAMIGWVMYSVSARLTASAVAAFNTRPESMAVEVTAQRDAGRRRNLYIEVSWPGRDHERIYWPEAWFRPMPDRCVFAAARPGDRLYLQGRRGWSGWSIDRLRPLDARLRKACPDGPR